ncbi:MAG: tetratricopeptide repeat protein [Phycisphaerae bacterium]|nr:tetratricopeptide repeat protein [Phycisphaerae bacterium]
MKTTRILSVMALASAFVAVGCSGPTKAGQEARAAARERMDKSTSVIVYDQARQSFESGQFDRAIKQIDEAIYRLPKESRYWVLRGRINMERGRLEEAHRDLTKATEADPKNAEAFYCMGIVHERWSKLDDAFAAYKTASELDPSKVTYLLAAAEVLIAQRKVDDATTLLKPKLEFFENNAPMHQLLGQIAMLQEDPKLAVEHYNRAMLIDPELPMILDNLVRAQFQAEEWEECLRNVRKLAREAEGGRTVERMRIEGRCLAKLGRDIDARNVFAQITREEPDDVDGWVDLATISWSLKDAQRTRFSGNRLVRLAPQRYEGYLFLGLVEEQAGNGALAAQWFEKARAVAGPESPAAEMLNQLVMTAGVPTTE